VEARALGCAYDAQMMSSASPAIAMRNKKSTIVSAKLRGGGNSTGSHAHASHASRIFFDCFWISSSPDRQLCWRISKLAMRSFSSSSFWLTFWRCGTRMAPTGV